MNECTCVASQIKAIGWTVVFFSNLVIGTTETVALYIDVISNVGFHKKKIK